MNPVEQSPEVARVRWLARAAVFWGLLIFGRLVWLQVFDHEELARRANNQQVREMPLRGPRGAIVDRNGGKLAVSRPSASLAVNPRLLKDPAVAAEFLGRILSIDSAALEKRIRAAGKERRGFLRVKRRISMTEAERLRALRADWIDIREASRREYPKGTLAAHLLGSVDFEERGNSGLEQSLQEELEGRPGYVQVLIDAGRNGVETRTTVPPQPGKTVALTIDERLQYICDRELKKAVEENNAQTGTIVVMNPHNGEILALSSYPTYDPNEAIVDEKDESRANVAVTYACEPGSVFKIFTIAAALETTRLRPQTVINCGRGVINLHGQVIHDLHAYDALPMEEVLWRSSNIGAVNIGLTVGKERLYEYLRRFGFGSTTGVTAPGESAGLLRDPSRWTKGSIGYISFGHEVMSTTLQLAQGASVIANGGYRVKPKLVLWRQRPGGEREVEPDSEAVQVLRPETAVTMRQMMEGVVLKGTGKRARLAGYTVGGKTGTAQIFDPVSRRYFGKVHNSTFLGMAPLTNPAIVVVVTINGTSKQGGQVSAPVFKEVAAAALRLMGVTRDLPDPEPPKPVVEPETMLAREAAPKEEPVEEEPEGLLVGPRVPDWSGKSVRVVLRESMESGLPVEIVGTGLVRGQSPPAGRILRAGERIRVQFAR